MTKACRILALILLVVAGSGETYAQRGPRATQTTVIEVTSRPARVQVGQTIQVTVRVRGAREIGSVPFSLFYDPSILEYVPSSAREGRFLKQGGAATVFLATPSSRFDAITVGHSRLGRETGASGSGTLCTLRFKVIGPGTSPLSPGRAKVLSPTAEPQPASFTGTEITARSRR